MATEQQEHLKIEQLRQHSADELEHIEGREKENLEGWIPTLASDAEIREALEKAFDYRGDVTITRKDGSQVVGLSLRPPLRFFARRLLRSHHSIERADQGECRLLRYRRARLHGPRYGSGQDLRGLGQEVLGEEGGRRAEHPDRTGEAGLKAAAETGSCGCLHGWGKSETCAYSLRERRASSAAMWLGNMLRRAPAFGC